MLQVQLPSRNFNPFGNRFINDCASSMSLSTGRDWPTFSPSRWLRPLDDVTRPFFPKNDWHLHSLEHCGWYPETRLVETYTPIPHVARSPFSSDPQKPQKPFLTSHFWPPWPLPLKKFEIFRRNKTCHKICPYEFFVKTEKFPIGKKLSRFPS